MNPPSSYIAPFHAARMTVMPGITPVSMGGDSLGGTVSIDSTDPAFAQTDERVRAMVNSSGFYRSNGQNYGGSFTEWTAGRNLGLGYSASWATNDDYIDGSGHRVTSSYAQTSEQTVTLAARGANNFVTLQAGLHHVPNEGFPSAQMDMVRDYAETLNLHYRRSLEHGVLDSHVYWQGAWHSMNIGKDKSTFPMPMWMPMNTHGKDLGYSVKLDLPLFTRHGLKIGDELHRFVLDDRWPAVPGTAPAMGPDTFLDINNGQRTRLGWFAEVTSEWNSRWTTLVGLRNDTVWMDTGAVHGYSMMYAADANTFNAANRARRDEDLDATAWARYEPNSFSSFEAGFARKSRAPNLYERYAWSTSKMTSGMIGWFGDGNYYVGNLSLRPEIANTFSGTATWHDPARASWEIKLTPFLTPIHDFVEVDTLKTFKYAKSTLAQLRFVNHDARIAGLDLSGSRTVWQNGRFGMGRLNAVAGWQHGERTDTSSGLYQMMPLHLHLTFDEQKGGFAGGFGMEAVDRKSDVDPHRYEQKTPGYALIDLQAGYHCGHLRMAGNADNLLNRNYELPLGGVNFDDFLASGRMNQIKPLTGRGRSVFISLSAQF
jgi:iron complex outermembrane recepter protein